MKTNCRYMKRMFLITAFFYLSITTLIAQTYTHVEAGAEFTLALRSDSTLWAWGYNLSGQLGNSIYTSTDTPVSVYPAQKWIFAATGALHSMAIAADSTLWGWGLNGNGQLGLGTTSSSELPTQVSNIKHWRFVSAGEAHTMAILNDGTLWATGMNMYGQLGTGDTVQHRSFVQIGTDNTWKTISAGGVFTLGIKQNGTLWAWGFNGDGELGTGTTTDTFHTPVQIGTATDWVMVSGGFEFSLAMKSDGTIWATGFNGNGQLGISSTTTKDSLFTKIGSANDWKYIAAGASFGFGIKNNGTLWGWGFNSYGQLGTTPVVPVAAIGRIGNDSDWHYICGADGVSSGTGSVFGLHSAGFKNSAIGICTAGADYEGQLGIGSVIALPGGRDYFSCEVGQNLESVNDIAGGLQSANVYPNPASSELTISAATPIHEVVISSLIGQPVFSGRYNMEKVAINVAGLASGVYFVKINNEVIKKFVKE